MELQADICEAGEQLTKRVTELKGKVDFQVGDIIQLSKSKAGSKETRRSQQSVWKGVS